MVVGESYTREIKIPTSKRSRATPPSSSTAGKGAPGTGSVTFIGSATTLIRCAGFTILTDPAFLPAGEKVSFGLGLRSARLADPAIDIKGLPPLDFILLSHFHEAHFDREAMRGLAKSFLIVTACGAAGELGKRGFTRVETLDTWESIALVKSDVRLYITAMPARHARPPASMLMPAGMGSMLDFWSIRADRRLARIYVTGDTVMFDGIAEIARRFPDIDLALVHLGGAMAPGARLSMDAREGAKLLRLLRPKKAIPVHYGDYDIFRSPIEDFARAAEGAGMGDRVVYLARGDTYTFDLQPAADGEGGKALGDAAASAL